LESQSNDLAGGDVGTILDWTLTLESDGIIYTWSSTPSGFSSSLQNPTDTPSATTEYTISADYNGCVNTSNVTVNVTPCLISPLPATHLYVKIRISIWYPITLHQVSQVEIPILGRDPAGFYRDHRIQQFPVPHLQMLDGIMLVYKIRLDVLQQIH
jgi:hypothetical protein